MQKQNYIRSGKSLQTDSLADIIQYMGNEKGFSDGNDKLSGKENKRKKDETNKQGDTKRIRGGSRGKFNNNKKKSNNKKPNPNDPCP